MVIELSRVVDDDFRLVAKFGAVHKTTVSGN